MKREEKTMVNSRRWKIKKGGREGNESRDRTAKPQRAFRWKLVENSVMAGGGGGRGRMVECGKQFVGCESFVESLLSGKSFRRENIIARMPSFYRNS